MLGCGGITVFWKEEAMGKAVQKLPALVVGSPP